VAAGVVATTVLTSICQVWFIKRAVLLYKRNLLVAIPLGVGFMGVLTCGVGAPAALAKCRTAREALAQA
jgi:hypothetical protein